jgi:hypothetical protein
MAENPHAVVVFIGTVVAFAGEITPKKEADLKIGGWLPCDGRALDSHDPDYADFFEVIATTHGAGFDDQGNRTGDFNAPDYRGRFLRGVAGATGTTRDPGATARQAMKSGGNSGNAVGSLQDQATGMPSKNRFVTGISEPATHHHPDPTWNGQSGPYELAGPPWAGAPAPPTYGKDYGDQAAPTDEAGAHTHSITGGDEETRPKNAYVNWIIKYKQI